MINTIRVEITSFLGGKVDIFEEVNTDKEDKSEVLSFSEFIHQVNERPKDLCRHNCLYLKDMFDYYGKNEDGSFKIFTRSYPSSPAVRGQVIAQNRIYQNLVNFTDEGFNNKFILLVGPNGSAKSSIIKKIMEGAEEYSKTDEGALYTFSWIFPIDSYVKGQLGLGVNSNDPNSIQTYAHLDDKEISSIISSELQDHPLLLIPLKKRQTYLKEIFRHNYKVYDVIKKSYLFNGDISKRNRMIYDSLLKSYQGDHLKVYKHIRIERMTISKRYSKSAVTIEPQLHVDARIQQITMDKRLANLPPSLQSMNLFSLNGEIVMANRGILEFSDLLKRPLDTYKYLLMTMESRTINLHGILTELDIFFIGSSNEIHLSAFKQPPDFNSFKGRINFIRVPYLLNYKDEERI